MASLSNNSVPEPSEELPSLEQRRALIERVAASEQFSRSTRLRDFLLYVGKQSLKDGCPEIREQEIGAKVFGRPLSYDRSQDNIVRVNATELRKRIEHYFASTGAHEPLLFEIPRGAYKLVFHNRVPGPADPVLHAPGESAAAPAHPVEAPAARRPRFGMIQQFAWPAACVALAILSTLLFLRNRAQEQLLHPWESQPAVKAFWTSFLNPSRETEIVLPDDSASVIEDITNRPIALGDYLSREYIRQVQNSNMSADRKADVYQVFNHNLVTFGGVRAAQVVLSEVPSTYPHYLTLSRQFSADEIKRANVVFIGGKKAVPWDHLFDDQLNFITDYDYTHGKQFVRNRNPKPGEQPIYTVSESPNSLIGYATIAYLPNPSHTGSVLILAGTDSDATGAAAAFLSSEEQMQKLLQALHTDRFPYFEVLLKTPRLSGTFFDAEPIAYRTYAFPE